MQAIIYHRRIQKDIRAAMLFYEEEGGINLADRFFDELEEAVVKASVNPMHFHLVVGKFRRIALSSFPFHLLYESDERRVRFLVLRHNKRHPSFGLDRR
jgi:plasmid stabilization system protein ParE